jgi:hypothetical protein
VPAAVDVVTLVGGRLLHSSADREGGGDGGGYSSTSGSFQRGDRRLCFSSMFANLMSIFRISTFFL